MDQASPVDFDQTDRAWGLRVFEARFSDGLVVRRSSSERLYTHAWLAVIQSGAEVSQMHGFSISRARAEVRIAEQQRLFRLPTSTVQMVRWEICDATWRPSPHAPARRRSLWR